MVRVFEDRVVVFIVIDVVVLGFGRIFFVREDRLKRDFWFVFYGFLMLFRVLRKREELIFRIWLVS